MHWLSCHNGAYRRLCGVAAVNRIDNVKTGIASGAGAWGVINETYRTYARAVGFHVDACSPGEGNAKGKVEAKVRLSRLLGDVGRRSYDSLEHLQEVTDRRLEAYCKRTVCPATGKTIYESWEQEMDHLASLPILPEPFDVVVTRPVHKDCMVNFENHSYPVPFVHVEQVVEVRGCAGKVQILSEGRIVREYPRNSEERVLIDPTCYEGKATERVLPPTPLGRMGRKLQEIWEMPVHVRPLDLLSIKPLPPGITLWGKVFIGIHKLFMPLITITPVEVDVLLGDEGLSLADYGIPGKILYTPGHSSGSVSVLLNTGEAFVGDLAMNRFPLRLSPGPAILGDEPDRISASWKLLLEHGATTVYPAHGKPFPADVIRKALS